MSHVVLSDVSFHYDAPYARVFDRLSLTIDASWRTGVVGRNGTGKSTLLGLIDGTLIPRGGRIVADVRTMRFPYAPQMEARAVRDVVLDAIGPFRRLERLIERLAERVDATAVARLGGLLEAYERLDGYHIRASVDRDLSLLGFDGSAPDRDFRTLSGGERTRALIVPLFLRNGTFPLIDEPTNHLDLAGRERLAAYLARQSGFVIVSHDRAFLDACVDHVVSIDGRGVHLHRTGFSGWERQKALAELYEDRRRENLTREIGSLERAARQRRQWSHARERDKIGAGDKGFVGARAARQMKRARQIERRAGKRVDEKRELLDRMEKERRLVLRSEAGGPPVVLRVQDLCVSLGGRRILEDVSLRIARSDRVAIVGPNGCGKTTLLRTIAGDLAPDSGVVDLPAHVDVVRAYQEPLWRSGHLRDRLREAEIDEQVFRRVMGSLGVEGEVFDRPLETFSLGERKKVDLCRSFIGSAHLFVWDEPMNEIDMPSREAIEVAVLEHAPTMLVVEHDRRFIDRVATRVVEL